MNYVVWLIFSIAPGHYDHERTTYVCTSDRTCAALCANVQKETSAVGCYWQPRDEPERPPPPV
jgi:hypothetical protein